MANLILRPDWYIPEKQATPENVFRKRRKFLKQLGFAGLSLMSAPLLSSAAETKTKLYPAHRHPEFSPTWPLTEEKMATGYNNFYEFSMSKDRVQELVGKFVTSPWPITINGLVKQPLTIDATELAQMFPLEERIYRFRCVEGWSMTVPWTGFSLSKLIEKMQPQAEAKFIRFETANRPEQMPGMRNDHYPWPYNEGLRMDEAMNPLTMVVTGIYGKPLPKQNGAPLRIIVPWKYGYKSPKSIVKIEFTASQPTTFWQTLAPDEYPFESNVNPTVPHPRWSQATERIIDTGDRAKTQLFNGYAKYVAKLYPKT